MVWLSTASLARVTRMDDIVQSQSSLMNLRSTSWQRFLPVDVILVALVYFCVARIALVFAFEKTNASPFWPPAGLAFAALIILGPRALPGILVGAVGANLVTFLGNGFSDPLSLAWWSLAIGGGNTMGAWCGWWVAGRLRATQGFILDSRCALRLTAGAATAGLFAGLIGATVVVFGTGLPSFLWPVILRIWSVGDAAGIIVILPAILHWWCPPAEAAKRHVWVTYLLLIALMLVQAFAAPHSHWPMWVMPAVPFLSVALRSRRATWSTANGVVLFFIWQTIQGQGPLADTQESTALLHVQLTMTVLVALLVVDGWWLKQPVRSPANQGLDLLFGGHLPQRVARVVPAIAITLLGVAISLTTWSSLLRQQDQNIAKNADQRAQNIAGHFTARLEDLKNSVQRIASRWENAKGTTEDLWRKDAAIYHQDFGCLQALEWIDRDTVIRWIEPLAGNERALGLRLSDEPVRRAALERSQAEHQSMFTSIITLKQGGLGFLMYSPIVVDDKSDGFIVAVFRLDDFIRFMQKATNAWQTDYHVQFRQDDQLVFDSLPEAPEARTAIPANLHGHQALILAQPLTIHAIPTAATKAEQTSSLPALVLNAGLLLSTLIGISITLMGVALTHAERSQDASQAKARFLATMSHEIRTPMNGILGAVELALARPLDEEARGHLTLVDQCGRTLLAIINDILDFSKIESGKLVLERIPLDLSEEVRQIAALFTPMARDKGLELAVVIDPALTSYVLGDPVRLRQMLLNLLSNALKFTEQGRISIEVQQVGGTADCPLIELRCRDSGIGMNPAALAKLFTAFTQADASTTRRFGGTGLGLAIVQQLVQLWGGTIRCDSTPGTGSTFIITLSMPTTLLAPKHSMSRSIQLPPAAPISPLPTGTTKLVDASDATVAVASAAVATDASVSPAPVALRALLAEDNPINQRLASSMLKKLGCTVDAVADGEKAVACCAVTNFDVVFMDMQMPVMDGLEAARRIRAGEPAGQRVPIIALTANAFSEDEAACLAAGMDAFLSKPVSVADLKGMIERFAPR